MMRKSFILATALSAIACFVTFFVLLRQPREEVAEEAMPVADVLQLDTVPLGGLSARENGDGNGAEHGIFAGNGRGELRRFPFSVTNSRPRGFQLSRYPITAPVLEVNGLCFVGDTNGTFWAFDSVTETVKWSHKTGNQVTGGAACLDDTIFVGSHDCDFYAFRRETGELLFRVECDAQINAAPAVSRRLGAVFFGNCDGILRKIDLATKKTTARIDLGSSIPENIVIRDETLYVLAHRGELTAVDADTFEIKYRTQTPDEFLSAPYATETFLFLTDAKGGVHVHRREDGTRLATLPSPESMTPLRAGDDSRVYAVSASGKLYRWRREDGSWHASLLTDLQTDCKQGCILAGNRLIIADETGGLYCYEIQR